MTKIAIKNLKVTVADSMLVILFRLIVHVCQNFSVVLETILLLKVLSIK